MKKIITMMALVVITLFSYASTTEQLGGYVYDSPYNLWKSVDENNDFTTSFWYSDSGWNQMADPEFTKTGSEYKFTFPKATDLQWQAQCYITPCSLYLSADKKYDMSFVIQSSAHLPQVSVKVEDTNNYNHFVLTEQFYDIQPNKDNVIFISNVNDLQYDTNCEILFDFGGNPAYTTVSIKNIVIKDHADDDGVVPSEPSTDPDSPSDPDSFSDTVLHYYLRNGEAIVSGVVSNQCENVIIPECVNVEGKDYPVEGIGGGAFMECQRLASVSVPNSVTFIDYNAFCGCTSLTSINIPNSVTTIGERAFMDCYALTSVVIPNSVTTIGERAFMYCYALTSVIIPNSVTTIGESAFSACSGLTEITIPNSVTTISERAFMYCRALTSVIIPNSVTTIGEDAFFDCSGLTEITIPNSVTNIGDYAFANCSKLTNVTNYATTPPECEDWSFTNYGTLYVPKGCAEAYKNAPCWSNFTVVELADEVEPIEGEGGMNLGDGELTEDSNISGNVIGNILYNINSGNGFYSAAENCLVMTKPTTENDFEGKDVFSEEFRNDYTGIVLKVEEGSGTIKVDAESTGNMMLNVRVGNNQPVEANTSDRSETIIPYMVNSPTYVYIYAGLSSLAKGRASVPEGSVKIYGVKWSSETSETSGIETLSTESTTPTCYNICGQKIGETTIKGLYISNGKKYVVK